MINQLLREDAVKMFEASSEIEALGMAQVELADKLNMAMLKAQSKKVEAKRSGEKADKLAAWASMLEVVKLAFGEDFANDLDFWAWECFNEKGEKE